MKTNKLILNCFIMVVFSLSSCKNNISEAEDTKAVKTQSTNEVPLKNETVVVQKDNVFEISQSFLEKNNHGIITSEKIQIDLSDTSGAMISAFSENKTQYDIFYRTSEKNNWSDWIELHENKEVVNPDRKAFSPKHLNFSVEQIQFKSSEVIKDKVIFRIYTFKKN